MSDTFVTKDAYETYIYFTALKRHFTSDTYDFFKYNGKIKSNPETFKKRKDVYQYYKLSKQRDWKNLILSNLLVDRKIWIGNLFNDKSKKVYFDWKKRNQALTRTFQSDIKSLNEDFNINFRINKGQHPLLIKLYLSGSISIESLVILCDVTQCFSYWNSKISEKIVWSDISRVMVKYRPFLHYDRSKFKTILLDHFG